MIYEKVLEESQQLDKEIKQIQAQLKKFPKGKLICTRNGKYYKWYWSDGKKEHYIPKKQRQLAERLALKKYLSYQLEDLFREKRAVNLYLKNHSHNSGKAMELLEKKPEYQRLISPYFKPKSEKFIEWMEAPYEKDTAYPEHLIHETSAGFPVRSKSEVMIVQFLLEHQIPFRYECALYIGGEKIFPDFTILHPLSGKTYYWEHFGLMDDWEYAKKAANRLQLYITNKMIPTIQLITTYETKEHPLSIDTIKRTIEKYFL